MAGYCFWALFFLCGFTARAAVIGLDNFDYSNGPIIGDSGGSGWSQSGGTSAWSGTATVSGGSLQTTSTASADTSATRTFGGNEAASALQITSSVFFRVTLAFGAVLPVQALLTIGNTSGGLMSFGRFGQTWGLIKPGFSNGFATNVTANSVHVLIAGVDYQNDRFFLFVDPDGSDFYSQDGGTSDVKVNYTGADALTRFTLSSTSSQNAGAKWDNLGVTTTFEEAMAVPEPRTKALLLLSAVLITLLNKCGSSRPENRPAGSAPALCR